MQLEINEINQSAPENFFFEAIPNKALESKQAKQILMKWGLADSLKIGSFRFNQAYNDLQLDLFLRDLFSNPNVRYIMNNIKFPSDTASNVQYQKLNCSQLSTQMFDQLSDHGIVSGDYIQKTFGDSYEGIQITDLLRQCLLLQQSDKYQAFNENQRKQLLFKIFQALVIGGSLNQYQDTIKPYLEWTKSFYKSLVSVRKQPQSGKIYIDATGIQIKKVQKDGFEKDYNPQNFIYVVICPSIRTVNILSNTWIRFW